MYKFYIAGAKFTPSQDIFFVLRTCYQSFLRSFLQLSGFGIGNYPASKVYKTELFPIVDSDGFTKPVILVHVEGTPCSTHAKLLAQPPLIQYATLLPHRRSPSILGILFSQDPVLSQRLLRREFQKLLLWCRRRIYPSSHGCSRTRRHRLT